MTLQEVHDAIAKIGCPSMTTLEGDTMHTRIISVCGGDDEGIYFLTMEQKPFYRQLKANPQIAISGIYPTSRKDGKNEDGQPYFPPGFTLRVTGEVREIPQEELESRAEAGDPIMQYVLEDQERYPAIRGFCVHKGKGEIFDFDFEMEKRDHKLLRSRFSFGGETHNDSGYRITGDCIECGLCEEACTFKAIVPGGPYSINGSRCDECGSCSRVCPQEAIEVPLTL